MQDLVESVKINGVLTPVLLRMDENEEYEMVSGHRRMHAAQLAGLTTIPAIVRELSDDDAIVAMVDANIQREELLPGEKAFAYKMKQEAMKHQGSRTDLTLGQNVPKFKRTTEAIADGTGESYKQIQRYIRNSYRFGLSYQKRSSVHITSVHSRRTYIPSTATSSRESRTAAGRKGRIYGKIYCRPFH